MVWIQDCEIDIQGVEKAEEAMVVIKQQAAMKVTRAVLTVRDWDGCCGR